MAPPVAVVLALVVVMMVVLVAWMRPMLGHHFGGAALLRAPMDAASKTVTRAVTGNGLNGDASAMPEPPKCARNLRRPFQLMALSRA